MVRSRLRVIMSCAAATVCALIGPAPGAARARTGEPVGAASETGPAGWHTPGYMWKSITPAAAAPGVAVYAGTLANRSAAPDWAVTIFAPAISSLTGQATSSELGDRQWAQQTADRLRAVGATPEVEALDWPAGYTDTPHGIQGWRVRAGHYPSQAQAQSAATALQGEGFPTATVQWTGYDADTATDAEQVHVAVIDPSRFRGAITASHGPVIAARTTTSELARQSGATVAVNGGFFITSDADGFQGVPSGLAAYNGKLQAMSVGDRAALVLDRSNHARIEHLVSSVTAGGAGWSLPIDGINRKPGLIRDCGWPGLTPTDQPRQDFTCAAGDDAVLFTAQFGASLPAGPGEQVILDAHDQVVSIGPRGGTIPTGGSAIQTVGAPADTLATLAVGTRVNVRDTVRDDRTGTVVDLAATNAIVSAAPTLLHRGQPAIDAATEGVIDPADRSFNFAWGEIRQPRTLVGTDAAGRLLLVTVDGREPGTSEGFTLAEDATFMREIGAVEAMNLDGGGSTAMAVDGQLVNHPSDATGERADGDAVVVIPSS
jgi:exopolysaccharide biosynthesis protein